MLKTSDFDFHLPPENIAQEPASPRDSSKLMLINRQTGSISHHHFHNLSSLINPNWTIVTNNTKVFPARILGNKPTGGKVELLLLEKLNENSFLALTQPVLKPGQLVLINDTLFAKCVAIEGMQRKISFSQTGAKLTKSLQKLGEMPTPPYITKKLEKPSQYQTVYAKLTGSAAAPTAGLHFTPQLLATLKNSGMNIQEITLHVGLGTFQPVKEEVVSQHHMHEETYTITASTADNLNTDKAAGKKILSVGTTTTRALEANSKEHGLLKQKTAKTDIYIYPPYPFRFVDGLITNFHLPKSTLLMMVSAFCSHPNSPYQFTTFKNSLLGKAYQQAIENNYRFYSFGDAMLII